MSKNPGKVTNSSLQELLMHPWTKLIAAITGAGFLLGMGYRYGEFSKDLDCKLEKIEMKQDFDEKLHKVSNECRELNKYRESVNNLEEVVKELKDKKNVR